MGALDVGGGAKKHKGRGRHPKRRARIRIDMTPMVDVAFLLLIFFMVTTVFRRPQALEITIPMEKAEIEVPEENVLQLRMTREGSLYWNIGFADPSPIAPDSLHQMISGLVTRNPAICAIIKIDRTAPYHWMVDSLDEIALGDLKRFSLAPFTEDDRLAITGEAPASPTEGAAPPGAGS